MEGILLELIGDEIKRLDKKVIQNIRTKVTNKVNSSDNLDQDEKVEALVLLNEIMAS